MITPHRGNGTARYCIVQRSAVRSWVLNQQNTTALQCISAAALALYSAVQYCDEHRIISASALPMHLYCNHCR